MLFSCKNYFTEELSHELFIFWLKTICLEFKFEIWDFINWKYLTNGNSIVWREKRMIKGLDSNELPKQCPVLCLELVIGLNRTREQRQDGPLNMKEKEFRVH